MGISSCQPVHARNRDGARGRDDYGAASGQRPHNPGHAIRAGLIALALCWSVAFWPGAGQATEITLATYEGALSQSGPGLLLQHLEKADDPAVEATLAVLLKLNADVLLLTDIDYDYDGLALTALQDRLRAKGLDYPEALALRPNSGVPTRLDLDHDGATGGPRDAQAYGRFAGQAGMAILSRYPIDRAGIRDFTALLWKDLPGADLPPDLTPEAREVQRLATAGHYEIPVIYEAGHVLRLLAWAATPPVFDGPEDRNGRRNADEAALWLHLLNGTLPDTPAPVPPFVVIGQPNLDPEDGDGKPASLRSLISLLQDPRPKGQFQPSQPGRGEEVGDPALDTSLLKSGQGLRLDMILPSRDIVVQGAGVLWPLASDPFASTLATAGAHRPVWMRLTLP